MPQIFLGEIGSRVNLRAAIGAAFPPYRLQASYADNAPIDLTTGDLGAVAWVPGAPLSSRLSLTTTIVDGAAGIFDLGITQSTIAELAALDLLRRTSPFILEWAAYLQVTDDVLARRLFYGSLLLY